MNRNNYAKIPFELCKNWRGKSFLTLRNHSSEQILGLLRLAAQLKKERKAGVETPTLSGKVIALVFEKDSTRTRCAFEVAALHQGGRCVYLSSGSHFGQKESVADSAQVLGGMFDAVMYRGYGQKIVETLAEHSGVPVFNGLTDEYHPTQILADFLTMTEHCEKPLHEQTLTYLGDGANNMAASLAIGCAKLGINFRLGAPEHLQPSSDIKDYVHKVASDSGADMLFTEDSKLAVQGADFIYTDVWLSMGGDQSEWDSRVTALMPYRVTRELMGASGNPNTKFLHCLPAYHDRDTPPGEKFFQETGLLGIEVEDDVFRSPRSVVFQQSENRLHTIKALMVAVLGPSPV